MESPGKGRRLILPEAGRLSALLASDVVRFDGLSAHKAVQLVLSPFAGIRQLAPRRIAFLCPLNLESLYFLFAQTHTSSILHLTSFFILPSLVRVGQASVPHVAEGFADDVGVEVVHLLRALPVVGGESVGLPLGQHGVDGQAAVAVADVGDNEVAVHHVVMLWAGAACQVELVLHRCWLFLIVVSPVKGLVGWRGLVLLNTIAYWFEIVHAFAC